MTALRDAIDTTTLGWIKPELDETLRQARHEIEAYAENPADTGRMRACAAFLHQVHGTLRMVELYAPAMVAEEMERLSRALHDGVAEVADRDDACAVLMRGVVLLPDYLERLQGGHKDIPIVLLPLLNELRAARGETGLSESVLFSPDLEKPLPASLPAPTPLPRQSRQVAAAQQLAGLREALAAWPEDGAPGNIPGLNQAIDGLLESADHEATRRMLWVASSVASALRDGALLPTRSLRQAFASVEREARVTFEGDGFGAARAEPTFEPTRQLLYHVAHTEQPHPALDSLRATFDLTVQQPTEAEVAHARGSLSGRNRALLDTVAAAIKEDLLRVKDALDLHLRTKQTGIADLLPQVEALGRVADTLGMMGLGVARNVVLQQRDAMHEIVYGNRAADEGALLDVAGALLYVDASLDDQVARLGRSSEDGDDDPIANESRKVLDVLVREAITNFGDARQSFVAFVETNWDHAQLAEVPRLLEEVVGALRILELPQPADYLTGIRRYAETELIGRKRVPNGQQLDTLADALASLEYYLEALREQRPNRDAILDIARQSLESLRYWPLPEVAAAESPLLRMVQGDGIETEDADADTADGSVAGQWAADTGTSSAAPVTAAPIAERAPAPAPAPVATGAAGGFEATGDEIDDEIREVFLEEFEEEISHLDELLPPWRDAPEDLEKLRPIRRVFHTLKGSGRLVGAKTLGEFAWKTENMLNRVLDGTRAASPAVVAMVDQTFYTLPQLHAALRGEAALDADLEGMQAIADRVAAGEEVFYTATAAAPAPVAVELPAMELGASGAIDVVEADAGEATVPATVDPVLLEILNAEVGGHLVTIDAWLAQAQSAAVVADDGLLRAIHTMNGAFAMTEVPAITEVTAPAETYVKRLLAASQLPNAAGIAALAGAAEAIRRTMAGLQASPSQVPVYDTLAVQLIELRDSLPEAKAPLFGVAPEAESEELDAIDLSEIDLSEFADLDAATPAEGDLPVDAEALVADEADAIDFEGFIDLADIAPVDTGLAGHPLEPAADFAAGAQDDGGVQEAANTLQLEAERLAAEEAEREEYARLEAEYAEAERLEAERLEAERLEAERLEAERLEAERAEAERAEAERAEAERAEAERAEAERAEAERAEAERLEAERAEAERIEAERSEAERAEAERLEAERIEAERVEAERIEAEAAKPSVPRPNASKPSTSKPNASTPSVSKPNASKPNAPKPSASNAPRSRTPRSRTPRSRTPRSRTPRSRTPRSRTPRSRTPRSRTPRSRAPRNRAPRNRAPRNRAPRSRGSR